MAHQLGDYAADGAFGSHLAKAVHGGGHTENHAVNGRSSGCFPPVFKPVFPYRNHMFLV
jgi:hypothetical protein